MVDTSDLGSDAERCESSNLSGGTKNLIKFDTFKKYHIFITKIIKTQMKNLHISLIGGDLAETTFKERV